MNDLLPLLSFVHAEECVCGVVILGVLMQRVCGEDSQMISAFYQQWCNVGLTYFRDLSRQW